MARRDSFVKSPQSSTFRIMKACGFVQIERSKKLTARRSVYAFYMYNLLRLQEVEKSIY